MSQKTKPQGATPHVGCRHVVITATVRPASVLPVLELVALNSNARNFFNVCSVGDGRHRGGDAVLQLSASRAHVSSARGNCAAAAQHLHKDTLPLGSGAVPGQVLRDAAVGHLAVLVRAVHLACPVVNTTMTTNRGDSAPRLSCCCCCSETDILKAKRPTTCACTCVAYVSFDSVCPSRILALSLNNPLFLWTLFPWASPLTTTSPRNNPARTA